MPRLYRCTRLSCAQKMQLLLPKLSRRAKALRLSLLACCLVALPRVAAAQEASSTSLQVRVEAVIHEAMAAQTLPAVSVAIATGGKLTYEKAFGSADLENAVPATTETVFRTGSIAKPITAVAAMQLVERGKLDLD